MNIIVIILITLAFSAFCSGSEIAFVSSNKLRFELEKKRRNLTTSILTIFFNDPGQFISTILVGNNIALVVYGIEMSELLHPYLAIFIPSTFAVSLVQTLIATIIIIFTGEFLPKTLFRINPNFFLKAFAIPLFFVYIILYPIAIFTTKLSVGILKMFGVKASHTDKSRPLGKIDLNYLIQESIEKSHDSKTIENEVIFLQNALDFSEVKLRDCIVPRNEIVAVSVEDSREELMGKFIESGNSKVVVFKNNIDNIIGYIDSAEMFKDMPNWQARVKNMPIVPETMAANKLMNLFTQQKKNMAIVVDEFGGTAGIVTLEDVMEEIFGEIEDEHDNSKEYIAKKIGDNQYILSGRLEIDTANNLFNLDIPTSDSYVTVAGFILFHYEKMPKANDIVTIEQFSFQVIKVPKNKIDLVKLTILN